MNKVGLTLNSQDMDAIDRLKGNLSLGSRAQAVRFALALADFLIRQLARGDVEIVLRRKDGGIERVHMAEFDRIPTYARAHEAA